MSVCVEVLIFSCCFVILQRILDEVEVMPYVASFEIPDDLVEQIKRE